MSAPTSIPHFEAIYSDKGAASWASKVKKYHKDKRLKMALESFRVAFFAWKSRKEKVRLYPDNDLEKSKREFESSLSDLSELRSLMGEATIELPVSLESKAEPFYMPDECRNILNLSDIHIPYQSNQALSVALKYGVENRVDTVLLDGDIMDFYAISRFEKLREKRNLKTEIEIGREFFQILRKHFPTQMIIYKMGNHEDRWEHHIRQHAEDFIGIDDFKLASILRLQDKKITIVPSKTMIYCCGLTILHGHELGKTLFSPVNPARGLFIRGMSSSIMGHRHQTSEHSDRDLRGKMYTCWSQGCLCELNPDYAPVNKFNHGFSHIKVSGDKTYRVLNFRIENGQIL